jgi:hypothetical protein
METEIEPELKEQDFNGIWIAEPVRDSCRGT